MNQICAFRKGEHMKVYIEGMVCEHCKKSVEEALKRLPEIKKVEVDLNKKLAIIELHTQIEDRKIKQAIDDIGFEVVKIER